MFFALIFLLLSIALRNLSRLLLSLLAGFLLGFYQHGHYLEDNNQISSLFGRELTLELRLLSDSQEKKNSLRGSGELISYNYTTSSIKSQIYLKLNRTDVNLRAGDILRLKGEMAPGFGEYGASLPNPELLAIGRSPPDIMERVRNKFVARMRSVFDDNECSSLALGYLVGDKSSISDDFLGQLRDVGLSHIIVASGFHLAVVVGLARKIMGKLSRFASVVGAGFLIVLYISIIGLSASLLRAGIVTIMSLGFGYFGRTLHPVRAIIYAIMLSLMYNPGFLTNAAWLLSFASYAGIVIFTPILQRFLYGDRKPSSLAQTLIVAISAQLSCAPISLYFFGSISFLGIVANLIISPTISLVMGLSCVSVILPIFAIVARFILRFQMAIVGLLAQWRWGILTIEANDCRVFLLYLPILILVAYMAWRERFSFRRRLAKTQKYGKIYTC